VCFSHLFVSTHVDILWEMLLSFFFLFPTVYTNSFLATLNARESMKNNVNDTNHMMMSIPSGVLSQGGTHSKSKQQSITIRIDTSDVNKQEKGSVCSFF
jgi:hypothetical protein